MARINARDAGVNVEGLSALNRALKELGKAAQDDLKRVNVDIAKEEANRAKALAMSQGGVAAKVAPSIDGGGSTTYAGIRFGGSAYPMASGAEFGSIRYKQFKPWRGNQSDAGYFIYPTIRNDSERIEQAYIEPLEDVMRKYGLI